MKINKFKINEDGIFVIAEIGNNHNGDFDRAIHMIDMASNLGVNAIKFQMRDLKSLYTKKSLAGKGEDLSVEYTLDLLKKFELTVNEHKKISEYCINKKIEYMCTPWDLKSLETLETFNTNCYKVSSADFTNLILIDAIIKTKKPLILSTGMTSLKELINTTSMLKLNNAVFALLHCNSTYPAPIQDINLKWINKLKEYTEYVGYSGHERGIFISLAAVGFGATIIERHFTLDRNMEGPDHAASLVFDDFKSLVLGVREIEQALGNENERVISQGEMINKENLSKSLIANQKIKKGTTIQSHHINIKSPGQGLSVHFLKDLIGKKIKRNLDEEDYFYEGDLNEYNHINKQFDFSLKWGIPVRFHDIKKFKEMCNPDLWEFHLSYSDLKVNLESIFKDTEKTDFVVHAPELFKNSLLMDLTTNNDKIRNDSIKETQSVINLTRKLKKFFPKTKTPLIICNIGGFSMDKVLDEEDKKIRYNNFTESLKQLDTKGIEIIPQTMAPFPWHFGGQRYQNLFLTPDEIVSYCKRYSTNICFDISHSWLTCNHFNLDFYEFCEKVAPYTKHIHVGDGRGVNGEGLQIGEGDINFKKLGKILKNNFNNASFIPEIWQGHKNQGEGFWYALSKLEGVI